MDADGAKTGLRPLARPVNVYNDFADQKVVVDISINLYKLAYIYRKPCAAGDYGRGGCGAMLLAAAEPLACGRCASSASV